MHPDAPRIQARLAQIDGYLAKGLMRRDEANAERRALERRLLDLALPDDPAPRVPWRARGLAAGGMALLVSVIVAWLLWGDAGLKPKSVEMLRVAAGKPIAPTVHPADGLPSPATPADRPATAVAADGPRISGRIELAPALARRLDPDAAVFIVLHLPGDSGLPLAALRRRAGDLPIDVTLDAAQAVGAPERLAAAAQVVLSARVSPSGRGLPVPGDLEGSAPPVPMGSTGVRVVIDRVRPGP